MRLSTFKLLFLAIFFCLPFYGMGQSAQITPIAGNGTVTYSGDGGPATAAGIQEGGIICYDRYGNLYMFDGYNSIVRKIDTSGIINTIAGTLGSYVDYGDGGPAILASFSSVINIAADTNNNLYLEEMQQGIIRKINLTSGVITRVSGGGTSLATHSPATADSFGYIFGLAVTPRGDLYFLGTSLFLSLDSAYLWKVDATTGLADIVTTSSSTPVIIANTGNYTSLNSDRWGNLYLGNNSLIYKLDTSMNLTVVAGTGIEGIASATPENALPATAAAINVYRLAIDDSGDIFTTNGSNIMKIDHHSGLINKVAGAASLYLSNVTSYRPFDGRYGGVVYGTLSSSDTFGYYFEGLAFHPNGTLTAVMPASLVKVINPHSDIVRGSSSDSMVTTCTIPAVTAYGITGTIDGVPAAGDSLTVYVDFGDGQNETKRMPYWRHISGADTTYGFGTGFSDLGRHTYTYPGTYNIGYYVTATNGYNTAFYNQARVYGSVCSTGLVSFQDSSCCWHTSLVGSYYQDTILGASCVGAPVAVKSTIYGWVKGHYWSATDSVYIKEYRGLNRAGMDSLVVHVVPVLPTPIINFARDTVYAFRFIDTFYIDTTMAFYSSARDYFFLSSPWYNRYYKVKHTLVEARLNSGVVATNPVSFSYFSLNSETELNIQDCGDSSYIYPSLRLLPGSSAGCALPFHARMQIDATLYAERSQDTTIPFKIVFGDGFDTTIIGHVRNNSIGYYYVTDTVDHIYTVSGYYSPTIEALTRSSYIGGGVDFTAATGCTLLTGTFFKDDNGDCIPDAGETRLSYWPYAVINNTTHDTTFSWCDPAGGYSVSVIDSQSYTIIPVSSGMYGYSGSDSLHLSCPSAGSYSFTAYRGTSYAQDFAFICGLTSAANMDLAVSGWTWGIVPGDTGVLAVWTSNDWGFVCDTLSTSVTLNIDTNLTYVGMWSGPAPTTVAGNTLTWNFATVSGMLDFQGRVKVYCRTTATIFDTVHNTLYVAPTRLTDPDSTNNQYTWSMPVRSSWDPNDKHVSPVGDGPLGYIDNGTQLSYMIHFQNMGSAPARNVLVIDTLDRHLNLATLQIIGSSATVAVYDLGNHVIQFKFADIYLPDSGSDRTGSNGYISFAIMPDTGLAPGTPIPNKAGIYFDYNEPVYTNQTINTIMDTATIFGSSSICIGDTVRYTCSIPGGTWSLANSNLTGAAGRYTGAHVGIDTITYTIAGSRVIRKVVTVRGTLPISVAAASDSVCLGAHTTLSASITTGSWSSLNPTIATITARGVVNGVASGRAVFMYIDSSTCGTSITYDTVYVNPGPVVGAITGRTSICVGDTASFHSATAGGVWTNTNYYINGIDYYAGLLYNYAAAGLDTIVYTVTNSCGSAHAYLPISIDSAGSVPTITGPTSVCAGGTASITLTGSVGGGTWSSGSTHRVTVSTTGAVWGYTAGTDTVYYTVTGSSCGAGTATYAVTVNAIPTVGTIMGRTTICAGDTAAFHNFTAGGSWSHSNAGIDSLSSTGLLTNLGSIGVDTIFYTVSNSCGSARSYIVVTVGAGTASVSISGPTSVCAGGTASISLTGSISGGTWSSHSSSVVTVSTTGTVWGYTVGTDTVFYTVTGTCGPATAYHIVSVNAIPTVGTVWGRTTICAGDTAAFHNFTAGGTWSHSNAGIDTLTSGGLLTNFGTAGIDTVFYTVSNSCGSATSSTVVTVSPGTGTVSISGPTTVCTGGTASISLTGSVSGGTWSSHSSSVVTVSTTGTVWGYTAGTDTVFYTITGTCGTATAYHIVAVQSLPTVGTVWGRTTICAGDTAAFHNFTAGGVWSHSNASIDTLTSGGLLTNFGTTGIDTIFYTVSNSCGSAMSYTVVTVAAGAASVAISGVTTVCVGATTTLTASVGGGVWSSSSSSIASISATGVVTGLASGAAIITYTDSFACGTVRAWDTIQVNAAPSVATISERTSVCAGDTAAFYCSTPGGVWAHSSPSIATISTSGLLTTLGTTGVDSVFYTLSNSCGATTRFTLVNINAYPNAGAITGATAVCVGDTIVLTDSVAGGAWITLGTAASVTTGGSVIGTAAGTATIAYIVSNSCGVDSAFLGITVNPLPAAGTITGADTICEGDTVTLSASVAGGNWASANTAVANISTAGVVTTVGPGSVNLSYSVTNSCGTATANHSLYVRSLFDCGLMVNGVASVGDGSIQLFPNPTTGTVQVQWTNAKAAVTRVSITDVAGRKVIEVLGSGNSSSLSVDLSTVVNGVYLYTLYTVSGTVTGTIVLNK